MIQSEETGSRLEILSRRVIENGIAEAMSCETPGLAVALLLSGIKFTASPIESGFEFRLLEKKR